MAHAGLPLRQVQSIMRHFGVSIMASGHPHGYEYDLFVSYSNRDLAWVRQFHDDLVEDINRFAEFDVFPFLDKARLQPGYVWHEKLLAAATDSAILVPVLSPRFFESDYCQKEVRAFVDAHGFTSGSAHRSRILPVKLLCAAPKGHVLASPQAAIFCNEGGDGIPYEHEPGTAEYKGALRKLAYAIAQVIKTLPSKQQRRPAVYLAPDFRPASEKLRASLEHHFDVLPEKPADLPGLSPEELAQSLERDFARCFASVHPLSETPFAKPVIDLQLEFARKQSKPRLVWSPERPDHLTNAGFEWFTSQAEIEDRLRRLQEKPAEVKPADSDRLIYFLCPDRANKTHAEPLLDALERRGLRLYPSPIDGPADQAVQTHMSALDELDGCLIYYGDVCRDWFDAVFLRVQRKIRQRRLTSAIFLAPPHTPHKTHDLRNLGVPVVAEAEAVIGVFLGVAP
jgi:TIR domain